MAASAHVLSLFVNDPLIKAILPPATTTNALSKELTTLQGKITNLENTITSLAKASKEPKPPLPPFAYQAKPSQQIRQPQAPRQSYAAKAAFPQCLSIVVEAAAPMWPDNLKPMPTSAKDPFAFFLLI